MAQIEINIDEYINETEKKELIVEAFKEHIKSNLFKHLDKSIRSDSEATRIIGNISHEIVMAEVQKYIPNSEQLIKDKVLEIISKADFSYQIFKKKDAWDKEESLAITYMNETIRNCKESFQKRIKETMENFDLSSEVTEQIGINFSEMADTIYKLSELFHKPK